MKQGSTQFSGSIFRSGMMLCTLLLGMAILLGSCSKEEDKPALKPEEKPNTPTATASITPATGSDSYFKNGMNFGTEGGENSASFTTTADWTVSVASTRSDISWCTVSPLSGSAGQATLKISATANDDYDDRSVTLTIKSGTASKTLVVNQKQLDALTLTTSKFVVDSDGGDINVEVKANIDFKVKVGDKCKDWIHPEEGSSRGLTSTNLRFNIDPNWEFDKREGEIIVQSGELVETLKVFQADKDVLLLTASEVVASSKGGELRIELNNEMEYDVSLPNVDWIVFAPETRNMSSHTLVYSFLPNTTNSARQADIVFTAIDSKKTETLTVTQVPEGYFETEVQELEVNNWGEPYQILVKTCEDYTVSAPSWAQVKSKTEPNARAESTLTLDFGTNTSNKARTGKMTLTGKESGKKIDIQITQPEIYVTSRSGANRLDMDGNDGDLMFEIESSGDYTVEIGGFPKKEAVNYDKLFTLPNEDAYSLVYDEHPQWIHYVGRKATDTPNVFIETFHFDPRVPSEEIHYQAIVSFRAGSKLFQVSVSTDFKTIAEVTPKSDWHIGCEGATFTIHVDMKKTLETPMQCDSPWITFYDQNIEKNLRDVMVVVKPNPDPESRVYNYSVKWNGVSITMSFLQDGTAASFVRSGTEVFAGNWEQTIPIELGTNDYTVEIAGNPSWLSVGEKKEDTDRYIQEFAVKANTTGQSRNARVTFRCDTKVQEINFTQLAQFDLPKIEVDAVWKNYPISPLEYNAYSNSAGAYLFNALVPDPIDFIDTMYRKVLSELYKSPADVNMPILPKTYAFNIKEDNSLIVDIFRHDKTISIIAQKLEEWYKDGGAEKMVNELQDYIISTMIGQFMIENRDLESKLKSSIKILDSTEEVPSWIAGGNYNDQTCVAFFFRWLVQNKDKDFLRKLNASSLYVQPWSLEKAFKYVLGRQCDLEELWYEFARTVNPLIGGNGNEDGMPRFLFDSRVPNATGTKLFLESVPDPAKYAEEAFKTVLLHLYYSMDDENIPSRHKTYTLRIDEDYTGFGGSNKDAFVSYDVHTIENWNEVGAENMHKEIHNHIMKALMTVLKIDCNGIDDTSLRVAIDCLEKNESVPTWVADFSYNNDGAAGYFFAWLTKNKDKDFLRKLNLSGRDVNPWSLDKAIKYALGNQYNVDELWNEFVKTIK